MTRQPGRDYRSIARNLILLVLRKSRLSALTRLPQRASHFVRNTELARSLPFLLHVRLRNTWPAHYIIPGQLSKQRGRIVAMIRLRNEELLLADTLDHLATFTDGIIVFDDASTDTSRSIAATHPHVIEVIVNRRWRSTNRIWEETANRRILHHRAARRNPDWLFYSDADERFEGDIRKVLLDDLPVTVSAVRVNLFDAYMTADDHAPYETGMNLLGFRSLFGVERRRILMAWRPSPDIDYRIPDSREPQGITGDIENAFFCQHYGKSLSIEEWEATCQYYIKHFPDNYRQRWESRIGKGVHTVSDYGTPLYTWPEVTKHGVDI